MAKTMGIRRIHPEPGSALTFCLPNDARPRVVSNLRCKFGEVSRLLVHRLEDGFTRATLCLSLRHKFGLDRLFLGRGLRNTQAQCDIRECDTCGNWCL